jgi:hypothetical protein
MFNLDQNKLMEAINQSVISKYTQNILLVKSEVIKLYSCFPFTGAANISDAQRFAMIKDMDKFIKEICSSSNN